MTSPYIAQAVERARLPVTVRYWNDGTYWVCVPRESCGPGDTIGKRADTAPAATIAYVQLRAKLEDGQ